MNFGTPAVPVQAKAAAPPCVMQAAATPFVMPAKAPPLAPSFGTSVLAPGSPTRVSSGIDGWCNPVVGFWACPMESDRINMATAEEMLNYVLSLVNGTVVSGADNAVDKMRPRLENLDSSSRRLRSLCHS